MNSVLFVETNAVFCLEHLFLQFTSKRAQMCLLGQVFQDVPVMVSLQISHKAVLLFDKISPKQRAAKQTLK